MKDKPIFFNNIFVKETETGGLININDLDKERYEAFLDFTQQIIISYDASKKSIFRG